ncbi:MAG: ATP-binding protein [Myxococcota bacterium]
MFLDDLQLLLRGLTTPVSRAIALDEVRQELHGLLAARSKDTPLAFTLWRQRIEFLGDFLSSVPVGVWPLLDQQPTMAASLVLRSAFGAADANQLDALEARRLAQRFVLDDQDLVQYSLQTRLISGSHAFRLTSLGDAFLRLTGREAIRFLLVLETELSVGDWDDWRASRGVLEALEAGVAELYDEEEDQLRFPCSEPTLKRLRRLQVARSSIDDSNCMTYRLAESMRSLVRDALDEVRWRAAVRSMLRDDADRAVLERTTDATATRATRDLSRLVTHEVRNALVPVRRHAEQLTRSESPDVVQRAEKILGGVKRVLVFVDQLVGVSEVVSATRMPTRLSTLVDEATLDLEGHERVTRELTDATLELAREPLARALRNVVQNALQLSSGRVIVRATVDRHALRVEVEDEGPGVPEVDRERVFEDGFTTREGGTGYGLAMTRRILTELGGTVTCETGRVLSGACFVLALRTAP